MPQIFSIGSYYVYFWSNEERPLEPIHFHVSKGTPHGNATKIWVTEKGHCILENNNSRIPEKDLKKIMKMAEAISDLIIAQWLEHFDSISYRY